MKKRNKNLIVTSVLATGLMSFGYYQFTSASNETAESQNKYSTQTTAKAPSQEQAKERDNKSQLIGKIHGKVQDFSLSEATKEADLIIKVKIGEVVKELEEPTAKTLYNGTVLDEFKNNTNAPKEINIMQQGNSKWSFNDNDPFKEGDEYFLFLKKAVGEYENTYWILGEETTFYKLEKENKEIVKQGLVDEDLKDITKKVVKSKNKEKQYLDQQKFLKKLQNEVSKAKDSK
jgi:flagellum-specific peptidoglycan hydrolase FlgJ